MVGARLAEAVNQFGGAGPLGEGGPDLEAGALALDGAGGGDAEPQEPVAAAAALRPEHGSVSDPSRAVEELDLFSFPDPLDPDSVTRLLARDDDLGAGGLHDPSRPVDVQPVYGHAAQQSQVR